MKRILPLLLCLCLALTACQSAPTTGRQSSSTTNSIPTAASRPEQINYPPAYNYTLTFAGDVSLADGSTPLRAYNSRGLEGCFDEEILRQMQEADLFVLNSEFSFTTRGTRVEKNYNFRGHPSRITILDEMGVDLAILANNHVFDYGEVGLTDTLNTFKDYGMPFVGAGENIEEASAIYYAQLGECTVAFVAGNRVEWAEQTRGATETKSGVFRTAESNALICQRISEAREKADYVVVYIHWGMEGDTWLEPYQTTSGKQFIDAGADVVVGDHPHVVQGIEYYKGKPIFYSLGNYWFSAYGRYTMLLNMIVERDELGNPSVTYTITPGWTQGGRVTTLDDTRKFYDYMESISVGDVVIDDDGTVWDGVYIGSATLNED